jgi:hypothetical protein
MVINIHKRTEVDPAGDCMKSYILSSSAYSVPDWWLSFSRVNTYYLKKALILVARVRVILFLFPEMVVDLDHLVVQLIHAVEQSHSRGVCHGEKHFF